MKTSLSVELPGKLIAVEGLDGSGKSTQLYLLKRWLELRGLKVYFTEWNSSVIVKKATSKGKKRQLLTPTTFSLIHCTDFADRYERQILPLLKAGYLVLCDRYFYTAFARDAVRGCPRAWLRNLYGFARHPDLTLFFDTPLSIALGRILSGRPQLKFHEAGMDLRLSSDPYESFSLFQEQIYREYLGMKDDCSFVTIDGAATIEEQQTKVREIVSRSFDLPLYRWKTII
jgi:dTMP kinase